MPLWLQILRAALRARSGPLMAPGLERPRRRGVGSFLLRLLLIGVVLFLIFGGGLVLFGLSLLQGF